MITEISKYLLKVKNKDVVVLVSLLFNFEHISYLFLVFLFACLVKQRLHNLNIDLSKGSLISVLKEPKALKSQIHALASVIELF